MILIIDKKNIDLKLENEKNLKEVIENINNWLSNDQLLIEKLYINDEDYSDHNLDLSLENIKSIEIKTLSFTELNINNISWIIYFFNRIINAIDVWDKEILKQIKNEIPFVLENLPQILSLDNKIDEKIYSESLYNIMIKYDYLQCKEEIVEKNELSEFLNKIILLLNERINEYNTPTKELKTSIKMLYMLKEDLESVSIFLQIGKNEQASEIMTNFTSIFHKVLRILNFNINNTELIGDKNIIEFTEGLDEILGELLEGFESNDTVLIGDILEYELTPRIETLKSIFN